VITLYAFGPAFGLPDPSPFVLKVETLLKMSGRAYRIATDGLGKAPKGKLPYIDDDGERVADSTFIRWHIEKKYNFDFDRGLSPEQRAIAWALEKMVEDNLYWTLVDTRWNDDGNFHKSTVTFFAKIPAPLRPIVIAMIRRQIRKALRAQGMGRHSGPEIVAIATRSIDAIADKPFIMGAEPTGVDATMFAFVAGALCPVFDTPIRTAAERHDNLKRYVGRMTARFYPGLGEIAGVKAAA
jgi:glutathione S-transferase